MSNDIENVVKLIPSLEMLWSNERPCCNIWDPWSDHHLGSVPGQSSTFIKALPDEPFPNFGQAPTKQGVMGSSPDNTTVTTPL